MRNVSSIFGSVMMAFEGGSLQNDDLNNLGPARSRRKGEAPQRLPPRQLAQRPDPQGYFRTACSGLWKTR